MKNLRLEQEVHPSIYFAYGSNLNMHDMRFRAPGSSPICAATLPGYRLSFTGVLTIENEHPGEHVLGGLFRVSAPDIFSLDCYEGYPRFYVKRFTHVRLQGKREEVFYYAIPEGDFKLSPPSPGYYDTCAEGYKDFGLDLAHLEAARKRAYEAVQREEPKDSPYDYLPLEDVDLTADLDWTPRG